MTSVTVYLYDLSNGLAKNLSLAMTGKQIDGIYHTSVVVFGREYCFGQGVEEFAPGQQHSYGQPIDRIDMGITHLPKDVWLEYLDSLKSVWTKDKYHLLDNNCNNFSDEVCMFLVNKNIPSHITNLPLEFLNTNFGRQMRPMIESMYGISKHQVEERDPTLTKENCFKHCTSLQSLEILIKTNRCVAIDFTSKTCGPCVQISPYFAELVREHNLTDEVTTVRLMGVSVEIGSAREIAQSHAVTATPTFKFFLDGKLHSEFKGADRAELKSSVELLLYTAYPRHKHALLRLSTLKALAREGAVGFVVSSDLEKIFKKLGEVVAVANPPFGYKDELANLKGWMTSVGASYQTSAILPYGWDEVLVKLLDFLPTSQLFPLLDILRLLAINPNIANHFTTQDPQATYVRTIARVLEDESRGMATTLMLLKFIANLFPKSHPSTPLSMLSQQSASGGSPLHAVTSLVIDTLLAQQVQVRQAAALLAYNVCWGVTLLGSGTEERAHNAEWVHDGEWASELTAALCNALEVELEVEGERSSETVFRLVGALGLLLVFGEAEVVELAEVVGLDESLKKLAAMKWVDKGDLIRKVAAEVLELVRG